MNHLVGPARRFWAPAAKRRMGIWGLWLYGGAMLSVRKRWLFHASHPHLPIHTLLSLPSVLIYNTREAPYVRHLVA
jgi:hypothetical protein